MRWTMATAPFWNPAHSFCPPSSNWKEWTCSWVRQQLLTLQELCGNCCHPKSKNPPMCVKELQCFWNHPPNFPFPFVLSLLGLTKSSEDKLYLAGSQAARRMDSSRPGLWYLLMGAPRQAVRHWQAPLVLLLNPAHLWHHKGLCARHSFPRQ